MTKLWIFLQVQQQRGGGFVLINAVVSGCLFSVFERRFGAEGRGLDGKWPLSVELRQAWELSGYHFCLVKARQIAVHSLLL